MNYFSLWTENFGVVPWLLFLFFLCLPIFLALRALLVLVCCVLEAISYSFSKLSGLETSFLSKRGPLVKEFLGLVLLLAGEAECKELKTEDFFLSKGEQTEISLPRLESFSVGNKEVLKSKYYAARSQLLIKARSLGFSDLVVWHRGGGKTVLRFYVVSKREQLNNYQIANDFRSIGLRVKPLANELLVDGEIKTAEALKLFNRQLEKNSDKVVNIAEISPSLSDEIIADIYLKLAPEAKSLICSPVQTKVECVYEGLDPASSKVRAIARRHGASFVPSSKRRSARNYKIELKIVRTDLGKTNVSGLGLDRLKAKVGDLLNGSHKTLVSENELIFSEEKTRSKIVASPSITTGAEEPGEIQLGAEIPVTRRGRYGESFTEWKFAGLKLKTLLKADGPKLKLKLESELTHPAKNQVKGSKSKNNFYPGLEKFVPAFQVKYETSGANESAVPGIGDIPVLGALFTSSSENGGVQWLIGYVKITEASP